MTNYTNQPMPLDVEAGKTYAWCSCGLSETMPLCDGTHKTAETDKRSVKFEAQSSTRLYLCGCGRTDNAPYCDGSHPLS